MRSVSGERAQVKAGEREGGSRVMNLALGGWWRLCHRVQLEHLVQLKHLEHPVHLLHLVQHLTMYCKCNLCLLALLSQLCVLLYILRIKQTQTRYIVHVVLLRTALSQTFIETAWIAWQKKILNCVANVNKLCYNDLYCLL